MGRNKRSVGGADGSGRAVGENVGFLEAGQIQPHAIGQIGEGGARQPVATLAREHRVELFAQAHAGRARRRRHRRAAPR